MADMQKLCAAREAAQALNLRFGRSVTGPGAGDESQGALTTGFAGIDHVLGVGGIPRGRITEIYGGPSCGKTTLALQIIARTQRDGGQAAFIDAEHSFDPDYAAALGVDVPQLYFSRPDSGEMALSITERLAASRGIDLIVIDSAAALLPREEQEAGLSDPKLTAAQARMMSCCLRRLNVSLSRSGTALIFINQLRSSLAEAGMNGCPDVTSGGMALAFYAAVRLQLTQRELLQEKDVCLGARIRLMARKNKLAVPYMYTELDCRFSRGFDILADLVDQGLETGVLQQQGPDIRMGNTRKPGRQAMIGHLETHPELEDRLRRAVSLRRIRYGPQPLLCETELLQNDIVYDPNARDTLPPLFPDIAENVR